MNNHSNPKNPFLPSFILYITGKYNLNNVQQIQDRILPQDPSNHLTLPAVALGKKEDLWLQVRNHPQ